MLATTGTTDAVVLGAAGRTPAVCFGPYAEGAHRVDERVWFPSVVQTAQVMASIVRDCVRAVRLYGRRRPRGSAVAGRRGSQEVGHTPDDARGVPEIRRFFRTNETPIYFVSATAFNLLGIDRWVGNFRFVNYYDSFDGQHPNVFVPAEREPRPFELDGNDQLPPRAQGGRRLGARKGGR